MNKENKGDFKEKRMNHRGNLGKIILLIIYLFVVVFLFYILLETGINPIIIFLLLGFLSLLIIGSFFIKKKKDSIYSKLYPDKKRNKIQRPPRKLELKIEADSEALARKKFRDIDLNFKHRKTLINNCENCGMLITGYKRNCPTCGRAFELKEVIKKCKTCGIMIPKSVKKCPICGTRTA